MCMYVITEGKSMTSWLLIFLLYGMSSHEYNSDIRLYYKMDLTYTPATRVMPFHKQLAQYMPQFLTCDSRFYGFRAL